MTILNSTKGSELIRQETGRPCTRQNLEKLCNGGRLPKSCLSLKPLRVDGDLLVAEFLANVDVRQANTINPGPAKAKRAEVEAVSRPVPIPARRSSADVPDYNESRARHEYEKANLAELVRLEKEALLLPRGEVERAWADSVTIAKAKLLAVPTRAKQRIPHLTLEEIEILTMLQREALEELSSEG